MPIYLVIFVNEYLHASGYAMKTIYRVIPTTMQELKTELDKHRDLLNGVNQNPYPQWELVKRPDNSHLEEMVEK